MDNILLLDFLRDSMLEEKYQEYDKIFGLLEDYEYHDIYSDLTGYVLDNATLTNGDKIDLIVVKTNEMLDEVLKEHGIEVTEETTSSLKYDILKALYDLQHLDYYHNLVVMVHGSDDVAEVIGDIVNEIVGTVSITVTASIETIDERLLEQLRTYVESKITIEATDDMKNIAAKIKNYYKVVGKDNVTYELLQSDITLGEDLPTYLPYLGDVYVVTLEQLADNVLGIIVLTGVETGKIIDVYREHAEVLIGDLLTISKVETLMMKRVGEIKCIEDADKLASSLL